MTLQSMVTVSAPIPIDQVEAIRAQIDAQLGNPAMADFRAAIDGSDAPFLHFASLHALKGNDDKQGYLVLEFSADGDESFVIAELARRTGTMFEPFFSLATDWNVGQDIGAYWRQHQVHIGYGLFDTVGLAFCGTPRQTVAAIRDEYRLAEVVTYLLATQDVAMRPLERLSKVRKELSVSGDFGWALDPAPPPVRTPKTEPTLVASGLAVARPLVGTILWPLILVLLPLCIWLAWPDSGALWQDKTAGVGGWMNFVRQVVWFLASLIGLFLAFTVIVLGSVYAVFARQEARDWALLRKCRRGFILRIQRGSCGA